MANNPQFGLQRVYLKDLSFESPLSPAIFTREWKPSVKVDMNVRHNKIDEETYEVILMVTLESSLEDEAFGLIEVQQAGIFMAKGLDEEQLRQALAIVAPTTLFPYLREVVDSVSVKGGFPAVNMNPVNFEAIYAQQTAQASGEKH